MSDFSKAPLLLSLAMLSVAPATLGQTTTNRQIAVEVTELAPNVTYRVSGADPFVVGYKVKVTNLGNNTLQNVKVFGVTSVNAVDSFSPTPAPGTADFKAISGGSCVQGDSAQEAVCTVPQLPGTDSSDPNRNIAVFSVFFSAPQLPPDASVEVYDLEYEVDFAPPTGKPAACWNECQNDNQENSATNDARSDWDIYPEPVALGTSNPLEILSALTPNGGLFYTGTGLVTVAGSDPFAIQVDVPPGQARSETISLFENRVAADTCAASNNFLECLQAEITIPYVAFSGQNKDWLTVDLKIDGSNLLPSFKPSRVSITYDDTAIKACPTLDGTTNRSLENLRPFAPSLYPSDPADSEGKPCLATVTKEGGNTKGKIKIPPNYIYKFFTTENGSYKFF